jgi:hypothetical protein
MTAEPSRRQFVASSASAVGGGWLWLQLPAVSALAACARDAARRAEPFATFTPAEGVAFRAFAARILPAEHGLPGAEEAGAAWFADRALGTLMPEMLAPVREGLNDLDGRARAAHGAAFERLQPAQQDALLRDVEESTFFFLARMLTLAGVFSAPEYGGNRDGAGDRILGVEHHASYQPPFGWYDEQLLKGGAA